MLPVVWADDARDDLAEILDYIAARNAPAADRMAVMFGQAAERLSEKPFAYRAGRVSGSREVVVHPNYVMVYRVESDRVLIVNVLHARQHYP